MPLNTSEAFDSISHGLGGIFSIVGLIFLIHLSWGFPEYLIISSIYAFCITFLFISSSLYHFHKKKRNEDTWRRKLDHIAIFFMIAGSYTAICYIFFIGPLRWGIIIAQWTIVLLGIVLKPLFFMNTKKGIDEVIYLIMGWMAIIGAKQIVENVSVKFILFIAGGGLAFTIGAILSGTDKPKPLWGFFGGHQIFHVLVLIGGALHYLVIYFGISESLV